MFTLYSSGSSQDSLHAEIGRRPKFAPRRTRLATLLVASTLFGAVSLTTSGAALAVPCTGPGAPTNTQTKCLTAVQIPGNPLQSYDISWVDPDRAEYYLADRSNSGIDVISTYNLTFKRTIGGFVGAKFNATGAVNNAISMATAASIRFARSPRSLLTTKFSRIPRRSSSRHGIPRPSASMYRFRSSLTIRKAAISTRTQVPLPATAGCW